MRINGLIDYSMGKRAAFFQVLIDYIFYTLLLAAPLIFYPNIENFSNLPKGAFIQFAASILWLCWVLKSYPDNKLRLIKHPLLLMIVLWLLWSGVSIIWAVDRFSAFTLWLHWFLCALCFFVVVHTIKTLKQLDRLVFFIVISANIISVLGFFQYIFGMETIPQAAIPSATFAHRNIAAQFVVFAWPFSLMLFFSCKNKREGWLFAVLQAIPFIFLYYTKTRAAWLAVLLSLFIPVVLSFFANSRRLFKVHLSKQKIAAFFISVIFIVVMVNIPPHPDKTHTSDDGGRIDSGPRVMNDKETLTSILKYKKGTASTRVAMWKNSLHIVKEFFPFGVGLANWYIYYPLYYRASQRDAAFSLKQQPTKLHNTSLQLLAETSILGFLLYVSIFVVLLWRFFTVYRSTKDPGVKIRMLFVLMAIVCFFINSLFTFPLRMAVPPLLLLMALGLMVVLESLTGHGDKCFFFFQSKVKLNLLIFCSVVFTFLLTVFNIRAISADGHLLKSIYFNRQEEWQMAKREAEKANDYVPWRHKIWFELARANDGLGLYEEAIKAGLRSLRFHPNHINSYLRLANTYLNKGDFVLARQNVRKVLDIIPKCDDAVFIMGVIKEKQSLISEAVQYYKRTIDINKKHVGAYFHLGIISFKSRKLNQAKDYLQKVIRMDPNMYGAHFFLGLVYEALNLPREAFLAYHQEIKLNPDNANAYVNLGLLYSSEKKWDKAVSLYKHAIKINPKLGAAHINIAVAYYMLGDYNSALTHSKIAKKLGIPQANRVLKQLSTKEKNK